MSQCKKFAPNIFHKTKCSNCFRQKEEHSAEALECNRASRSIARSGYLFVAPDWDFSVPLNRTKRWQRRWFVLYDDGELNYSVDEHPDTVPQGSVDMSQVLEVTGAEQVTGHPHSLALTGPDRVTFVKAASREDARWWVELLAVFPRRHKRNATFPGGRASPSLPQLGRSASPQPSRPRHLSCTGPSPRTNFTTPPLKEEPVKEGGALRPSWVPKPTSNLTIDTTHTRTDYVVTSGSPPTRDKLRCEERTRTGRDWRNERLRDIATALTDRSPESSLPFPAEGVLNLKKGWLWYKDNAGEWLRRWWVLCGSTLKAFRDQDEQGIPEVTIELATITGYCEATTEIRYGFQIQWAGQTLILSAVTSGIRSNWLHALRKATPVPDSPAPPAAATPRSSLLSSDEEYRTASEGGRRDSEDWGELPPSPPLTRNMLAKVKEKTRLKSKLPRNQSRQSTVDSVSTDELEAYKEPDAVELKNTINRQTVEMEGLRQQYSNALNDIQALEAELTRFKKLQAESLAREKQTKELLQGAERIAKDLTQKLKELDEKHLREQTSLQSRLLETERLAKESEEKHFGVFRELQAKQNAMASMQEELNCVNEKHAKSRHENDRLCKRVQEMECKPGNRRKHLDSLTDLTDVDLDADLEKLAQNELIEQCLDLRSRFEKAVVEIRAVKRELRESHINYDRLELENLGLKKSLEMAEQESQTQCALMAERVQDLTAKLAAVEKQARNLKGKLQDSREKRRSLSLKGRESCSINKEVEDKVTELEAKILNLERNRSRRKHKRERSSERASPIDDRSLRRIRRKSLDSVTASEPMKLLVRLSNLENKVTGITASNESLNTAAANQTKTEDADVRSLCAESIILAAKEKLSECRCTFNSLRNNRNRAAAEAQDKLEASLSDLNNILNLSISESEARVVEISAGAVVGRLETVLRDKLLALREKARTLRESDRLTDRARLELLAEKIAFENVIISRVKEALRAPALNNENACERLLNKEAAETASLLSNIRAKLNGVVPKRTPHFKTSVEHLTKVLAKRLVTVAHGFNSIEGRRYVGFRPVLKYLEDERDKVSTLLCTYKSNKLPQLAESLALETINLVDDQTCALDKDTLNDIWRVARETVNTELIQSEISHVLVRTAQTYEEGASVDQNYFFSFFACERAALELWSDSVELRLQVEVEKNIEELTDAYRASLSKLQRSGRNNNKGPAASSVLLNEFADILAHKALIDARIGVLSSECGDDDIEMPENSSSAEDDPLLVALGEIGVTKVTPTVEAEFKCLLTRYGGECDRLLEQSDLDDIRSALRDLSGEMCELLGADPDEPIRIDSIRDVYYKCLELKRRVMEIKSVFFEMKNNKRCESEEDRRPLYLGTEYLNQVENLRAAYRCTLADCENRKQQADLEQLQVLCERVLVAMEHWHRRTLQDLREQHSRELQALRQDKEQALAEETQATLAALDAMRKAHEAEVQREVAKFKQDFARQQQDELLELTERLSVKCLEAAALEEQLGSATRQLAHAQKHILQLERNPQFSTQN